MPFLGNTTTSFNVDGNNINNGAITSEKIAAGAVVNADVNDTASIAGTKISADFGAQDLIVDTNLLFVDVSEDRIGVGTSSPAVKLEVVDSVNNVAAKVENTDTTDGYGLWVKGGGTASGRYITKFTDAANNDRLFIGANGNIGVGTTNPDGLLHLKGSNPNFYIETSNANEASDIIFQSHVGGDQGSIRYSLADNSLRFATNGTSNERLRIDSSGRVGIKTASPQELFHVSEPSGAGIFRLSGASGDTDNATATGIDFQNNTSGNITGRIRCLAGIGGVQSGKGQLQFFVNNGSSLNERVRINEDGLVGIGDTTPGNYYNSQLVVGNTSTTNTGITLSSSTSGTSRILFADASSGAGRYDGSIVYNQTDRYLTIRTGGDNLTARFDTDGLKFGSDTAATNALDKYEEGTWTPSLTNGGTVTINNATYTRIGRLVMLYTYLGSISSIPNDGSQFQIEGLPYDVQAGNWYGAGQISYAGSKDLSVWRPLVANNGDFLYFHRVDGSTASGKNSDFTGTGDIVLAIWYFTDA